jgi:hypothetical protein
MKYFGRKGPKGQEIFDLGFAIFDLTYARRDASTSLGMTARGRMAR